MKTAFVGGGRGCCAVLEMYEQGQLGALDLEILAVVDVDLDAPAMRLARSHGWLTLTSIEQAVALPSLELVIELTGSEDVLDQVYFNVPPGVRVMDHVMARVFWDLEEVVANQKKQLREKEALEQQLAAEYAQLSEILDTIPDVVMVVDCNMGVVRVNGRFEELTGESCDEAEALFCWQVFDEIDVDNLDFAGPFYDVMETGRPVTLLQRAEGRGGNETYYQVNASPVFGGDGMIVRVVLSFLEMTTQVMLERETQERGRRFRQIVDAVHGIITITDIEGRYQLVNPRAELLFCLTQEEMLGAKAEDLFPPEVAGIFQRHDRRALDKGGHDTQAETIHLCSKECHLISERFPLTNYKGEIVALCCVARDVTKERQLQKEMVQTERLAAVGKLAAGVAHELNNPLTGILTFAEDLFLEADADDPNKQDYEVIVNEALRCRNIVRDLLDFSRQKAPARQRVDINHVVERVYTMVGRQATFHNVSIELNLKTPLPEVNIDPGQVQQAILNLVINARDATDGCGTIKIVSFTMEEDRTVVVSVTDDGCGIPEDMLKRVFEPFYSTKGDQGNGLGLPAVQSLAQQHGGRIEVESQPGNGTTFRLVLPALTDETKE